MVDDEKSDLEIAQEVWDAGDIDIEPDDAEFLETVIEAMKAGARLKSSEALKLRKLAKKYLEKAKVEDGANPDEEDIDDDDFV